MLPGMNSRQAKQMMKKMGIQQVEVEAQEVIIRQVDRDLIIQNPQVSKVNMMGQETFQIVGEVVEKSRETKVEINEDDVQTVVDQTGKPEEEVRAKLEANNGDLAQTIMELQEN
jgi:nascent polypeptide-associated complex subunit alpha